MSRVIGGIFLKASHCYRVTKRNKVTTAPSIGHFLLPNVAGMHVVGSNKQGATGLKAFFAFALLALSLSNNFYWSFSAACKRMLEIVVS